MVVGEIREGSVSVSSSSEFPISCATIGEFKAINEETSLKSECQPS